MGRGTRRVLNYTTVQPQGQLNIDPSTIPDLIPKEIINQWQEGDTNPYYKIQKIDYPIQANRINYLESFFESFIDKLKERPIPGSKAGHEINGMKRPPTDLIMTGAKLDSNGDGTGSVYFKNYIPPEGESGSNNVFIKENKSDMIHFSLVSYTKDDYYEDDDGNQVINVIGSIKGERNDAVEYGLGAMSQVTNIDLSDQSTEIDFKDKKSNTGGESLKKSELFEALKNMKANAEITLLEIAEVMDLSGQVLTDKHVNALKTCNDLESMGIEDPITHIKDLEKTIKANADIVRKAELDASFGTDQEEKNYLRQYANKETNGLTGEKLAAKIEELKTDPIALKLAADKADYNSEQNNIGKVENKNTDSGDAVEGSVKVDKL